MSFATRLSIFETKVYFKRKFTLFCLIGFILVEQLKRLQEEHLKQQNNAIFADEVTSERLKSDELEIDRRCQELSVMFNRLHSILLHFQTLKSSVNKPNSSGSRMVCTIIRNIFQYQVQEVNNLTQLFRSCQRVYLDRRNEATKVDPQFVITFDEDLLNGELMAEGHLIEDSVFFEANDTQAKFHRQTQLQLDDQLELDVSINSHLRQREKEMNCILKSFAELNQIFHEVNTLVVDQGSALDRIDYNLEQVEHHVEMGAVSLEKAHRHITRVRKFKIILTFGLLMFLLLLIIIIRS